MHAFEDIAGLYREELRSLREDAVRFAVRNPGMARQLGLASDTQPDPLVNLLLESFAWLAARVRADAESRLPLVSHSLLGLLYPQFVCPIPSVGVAEFIPNPAGVAGLPDGFGIPAHTSIHNRDERGGVLRWRTARPLTLHPAKVVRASIIPPASWMPAAAQGVPGVLCLRIEGIAGLSLAKFGLPSLSLHLGGDRFATFPMPCVMRAWSRAGVCSPNPPTLCPDTSCCRSILPIPNTCCSGRWEGWSVGGNSGICQASISCSPWTRRRRKRFPQDCSAPAPYLWSTCSSDWRNPYGWITSARDICSCRICGTGTVRKSIP